MAALPRVKIYYENGQLGSVAPSADGTMGLCISAIAVVGKFQLGTPYLLKSAASLTELGVTDAATDANANVHKEVSEFYKEAGQGAVLWLLGVANTVKPSEMVDVTKEYGKKLIQAATGALRGLLISYAPAAGYAPVRQDGLDKDVFDAMLNAQALAEWATETMFAPLFIALEARPNETTTSNIPLLPDLSTYAYNRVALLYGDTVKGSGSAIGLLGGRIARIPVQRHVGRVKDGALSALSIYLTEKQNDSQSPELVDVESINDKGFITFRTYTGRAGYFFSDDSLATAVADDYRSLARRRVIDKAYRIAYASLIEELLDEVPVTAEGKLVPAWAANLESKVEQAIISSMTNEGNLSVDPADSNDTGVVCAVDYNQDIVATGRLVVSLRVKPFGYAKYIDVYLGFLTIN